MLDRFYGLWSTCSASGPWLIVHAALCIGCQSCCVTYERLCRVSYFGVDIVRNVFEVHRVNFQNNSQWMHFQVADFTVTPMSQDIDLIFCRDALQHLSLDKVVSALALFSKSSARFLLVGSYLKQSQNINITIGDYWDINLSVFPFELIGYERAFPEHTKDNMPQEPDKFLLLYPIDYLRSLDYRQMMLRAKLM